MDNLDPERFYQAIQDGTKQAILEIFHSSNNFASPSDRILYAIRDGVNQAIQQNLGHAKIADVLTPTRTY